MGHAALFLAWLHEIVIGSELVFASMRIASERQVCKVPRLEDIFPIITLYKAPLLEEMPFTLTDLRIVAMSDRLVSSRMIEHAECLAADVDSFGAFMNSILVSLKVRWPCEG
jgi:hypothetical protein